MPLAIVLGSASPRRRDLLGALVPDFSVDPADVVERTDGDPLDDAPRLAREKAEAVAGRHPDAIVIGADTIVHDGARAYGKPHDADDAVAMLLALRGQVHLVVTGVAVASPAGTTSGVSIAEVQLARLSDEAIAAYVASGRPLDKAGAYAIQDEDVPTVAAHSGCYCAVMGLPLWRLRRLLARAGVEARAPDAALARCASCPERGAS